MQSSGEDGTTSTTVPAVVDATVAVAGPVPTTIGRDSFLFINDCLDSNLFHEPYFDDTDPDPFYDGIDACDEALTQLEADGLGSNPLYSAIGERLVDADFLSSLVDDGTVTPAEHEAFADSGEGLYEELYPMLRALRGLDPSGGFFFADEFRTDVADESDDATGEPPLISYQRITDDTGALIVDVPIEWDDVDTAPFTLEDATAGGYPWILGDLSEAPWIKATPSIAEFDGGYLTPGIIFTALPPQTSLDVTLAVFAPPAGACTDAGIEDYDDGVYTGRFQTFTDCDGTGTMYITVAAVPPDNSFTAVVAMQLVSDTDLAVLDQVIATFDVST